MNPLQCGKVIAEQILPASRLGLVEFDGQKCAVFLDLVPEAHTGDYVLVEGGCAMAKLDSPLII